MITRKTLPFALAVLLAASFALAADAPNATGTWDVVATTPQGEMTSVLTIKKVEGQLKAEFEIHDTKCPVTEEKLQGNVLTLKLEYEGGVYAVEAKIEGDAMTGSWQGAGYSGDLKAKRRP